VRTYKPDEYGALVKKYHANKPIVVAFYIENIPVVPNIVYIIKHLFYVR